MDAVIAGLAAEGLGPSRWPSRTPSIRRSWAHARGVRPRGGGVTYAPPRRPVVSNLTGTFAEKPRSPAPSTGPTCSRVGPIRRRDRLSRTRVDPFLEIGPSPTLVGLGRRSPSGDGAWLPSLRRGRGDWEQLLESLGALYVRGVEVDSAGFDRDYPRRRVVLPISLPAPTMLVSERGQPAGRAASAPDIGARTTPASRHPIARRLRQVAPRGPGHLQEAASGATAPWLRDHVVLGQVIVPMTAYLEMALAAALRGLRRGIHGIDDLVIREP